MPGRERKSDADTGARRERMLISPAAGCALMIIFLLVIPAVALSWYPVKWRILLSRLESKDESVVLETVKSMRGYPAKEVLPVFLRLWATTPDRSVAAEIEPDLMRGLPFSYAGLGRRYFLPMIDESVREDFAKRLSRAFETGNPDLRRRALFALYIVRGAYVEEILLDALTDESMPVRHIARLCLIDIGDFELLEKVLESLRDEEKAVLSYSRIAILGRGFGQMLPVLVTRLDAKAADDRQGAIELLRIITGETHGFRADDPPDARAAAIAKWREYLEKKSGEKTASPETK